jgi:hypothetical protein
MGTIVNIADAAVLLLVIVLVPRTVSRGLSRGFGSLLLSICVAVFTIIFAVVSFTASVGFLDNVLAQIVWLLVLLAMAYVVRISWANGPAGE